MLLYDSQEKFRLLFSSHGSVVLSCVPVAFMNACMVVLLHYVFSNHGGKFGWASGLQDTWAASTVGVGISFAIVFRTNIAWTRYWEATSEIIAMWSKWTDGYTAMVSFTNAEHRRLQQQASKILPSGEDGGFSVEDLERVEQLNESLRQVFQVRYALTHDFSLLSALACHRLTHGDLLRMRRRSRKYGTRGGTWCRLFWFRRMLANWSQLVVPRQQLRWNDGSSAACLPRLHVFELEELEVDVKAQMVRKSKSTRQRLSLSWSASLDSQDAFKVSATDLTWSSDLPVLGRLTHPERVELERPWEIAERDDVFPEEDPEDPRVTEGEKKLRAVPDRMAIIQEWILEDMNKLQSLISMPPPIQSRAYAELSQGMLAFSQAVKMADFPFPFPFAQLLEWLLVAYTVVIPLFATVFTDSVVIGPFLSFLATLTYWTLTSISRELENPFADGPNQVPVIDMHERFVDMLRQVYHTRRPDPSQLGSRRPSCIFQDELSPKIQRVMTPKTTDPDNPDCELNGNLGLHSRETGSKRVSEGELSVCQGILSRELAGRRSSRHSLVSFDSAALGIGGPLSPKRPPELNFISV